MEVVGPHSSCPVLVRLPRPVALEVDRSGHPLLVLDDHNPFDMWTLVDELFQAPDEESLRRYKLRWGL